MKRAIISVHLLATARKGGIPISGLKRMHRMHHVVTCCNDDSNKV